MLAPSSGERTLIFIVAAGVGLAVIAIMTAWPTTEHWSDRLAFGVLFGLFAAALVLTLFRLGTVLM